MYYQHINGVMRMWTMMSTTMMMALRGLDSIYVFLRDTRLWM